MRDNSAPAEQRPAATPWVGPGAMLREARESKRLSVRAVADALHLGTDIIEALEEERFGDLPPLTFVKGYLRAYGKLVELPEEQLMGAFDRLGLEATEEPPNLNNGDVRGWRGPWGSVILVLFLAALAAALGWWWFEYRDQPGGDPAPGDAANAPATAPTEGSADTGGDSLDTEARAAGEADAVETSVAASASPAARVASAPRRKSLPMSPATAFSSISTRISVSR